MREVAVIGVGMTTFGNHPDKGPTQLGRDAIIEALKDTGLQMKDFPAVYSGNGLIGMMMGQGILKEIGMTGVPVTNMQNGAATGATAVRGAYYAIAAEQFDLVLVVGTESMPLMDFVPVTAGYGGGGKAMAAAMPTEGILGTTLMPGLFGMAATEHMEKYGTTAEQFAKVSVKNRKNGCNNPIAQKQEEVDAEKVLASPMVSYPLTVDMCSATANGGAVVILCSMDKASQYTSKPIKIEAVAMRGVAYSPTEIACPDVNTATRECAKEAYEKAGLGPKDLDVVELDDSFASSELINYENLQLCAEGEGGGLIDAGKTDLAGEIPVNPSGGHLARGNPLGASGVAQICEIVWQLRGEAGQRQVSDAKVGLAHCFGLGSAAVIHILTA